MSTLATTMESEQYSYDYFFLDYVCRICWRENAVIELTSPSLKDENKTLTIAEKILQCFGVDVSLNKYPEKICEECLTKIEDYSVFRQKCYENEIKLAKIFQSAVVVEYNEYSKEEHLESFDDIDSFDCETKNEIPIEYSEVSASDTGSIENKKVVKKRGVKKKTPTYCHDNDSFECETKEIPLEYFEALESDTGSIEKKKVVKKRGVKKKTPTYCLICHTDLKTEENLVDHNLEVHGDSNGIFKCFGCTKSFNIRNRRLKHERYLCKELKYGYKCDVCQIYLPTRTIWEQHFRAHKRGDVIEIPKDLFACKKCNKYFDCMENLVEHRQVHDEDHKQWVCDECGRAFNRRDYFNKHKMTHTGTKEHRCQHCSFTSVQKSTLNVHLRRHTGERPYHCDMCPQRCATSSNLREHKKRHLGIKSHECKVCNKKFGYKDTLEEHIASVHNRSENHTCDQCTATYTHFRGLRRHMLQKHGKKITKKAWGEALYVENDKGVESVDKNGVFTSE